MARFDGKAFHTLTRNFEKPYDERLQGAMVDAAKYLCENIQGSRLAYIQSDEITLLITQGSVYEQGWFDLQVQKMCSVGASMCTMAFNRSLERRMLGHEYASLPPALFDARFWNLPFHEIENCFIWRQQDAVRNSIQSHGRAHFSHKQLLNKNCNQIQEMLFTEKEINWNDLPVPMKRGICVRKVPYLGQGSSGDFATGRNVFEVDYDIPIFTQKRYYIHRTIEVPQEARL